MFKRKSPRLEIHFIPAERAEAPCPPAETLRGAWDAGKLPLFAETLRDGETDAYGLIVPLIVDLSALGVGDRWTWARGRGFFRGPDVGRLDHTWLETGVWAVDVFGGKIVIWDRWFLTRRARATGIKRLPLPRAVLKIGRKLAAG